MILRTVLLILALLTAWPIAALGDAIEAKNVTLVQGEEALIVSADFSLDLSARLEEALNHGIALYFLVEFELIRPRWYWFDERTVSERLVRRLMYHPLSRQYRVSRGALYQNFPSLSEALRTLGSVREWAVVERDRIKAEESYTASIRMRLDTAQLPKLFQVSALTNRELTLSSDWKRVPFTAGPPEGGGR